MYKQYAFGVVHVLPYHRVGTTHLQQQQPKKIKKKKRVDSFRSTIHIAGISKFKSFSSK